MARSRRLRRLAVGIVVAALLATGCEWRFETLDGNGGPNGRTMNDVGQDNAAVLYNGRPHVFYFDDTDKTLRHAYYNGQFWAFETLDGNGGPNGRTMNDVGTQNAAVLYNGRPHVFYFDDTDTDLRHAYYNGVAWVFETLDGQGGPNGRTMNSVGTDNAVILYNGRPHVFYRDGTDMALRHAYYNGVAWVFETLDGNGGPNGATMNSVGFWNTVVLYDGRPHVFYYDTTDAALRHGYWNGAFWAFETLDGNGGPNGRTANVVGRYNAAILYNGRPHVFYLDNTDSELRHAYYNGVAWVFETLDGNGGPNGRTNNNVGFNNAAVVYNRRPHVFYRDSVDDALRHAYYNGVAWTFETLDGNGGPNGATNNAVGEYNAVMLYNGRPDVFYYDTIDDALRHGWFG